jgi:hypothetical protein
MRPHGDKWVTATPFQPLTHLPNIIKLDHHILNFNQKYLILIIGGLSGNRIHHKFRARKFRQTLVHVSPKNKIIYTFFNLNIPI